MAGKSCDALQFRKTRWNRRETYTYEFADGQKVTVAPGEAGCTQIDIRRLHSMDDHEVYVNIKVSRPGVEDWQKPLLEQWRKDHPGEAPERNWNLSLDAMLDADGGEEDVNTGYVKGALYRMATEEESSSPGVRMRELVSGMTPRRQAVYQLAMLDRIHNTRVAKMLGVSECMGRKDIKAIRQVFLKDKIYVPFSEIAKQTP